MRKTMVLYENGIYIWLINHEFVALDDNHREIERWKPAHIDDPFALPLSGLRGLAKEFLEILAKRTAKPKEPVTEAVSDYMSAIGRRGGSSKSPLKAEQVRRNGRKGGRPKKDQLTDPNSKP